MWRALFLGLAICLCILGFECLAVQKAVLAKEVPVPPAKASSLDYLDPLLAAPSQPQTMSPVIQPPEWAPWSLLSTGVVVMFYALTLNRGG